VIVDILIHLYQVDNKQMNQRKNKIPVLSVKKQVFFILEYQEDQQH
jgi:hypothetical protein